MDIQLDCPLGSKCEEIVDNKLRRCMWYTKLRGKNPQSEEQIDTWNCAMVWLPILLIENSQMTRGVNDAVCSMREETIVRQDIAIKSLLGGNNATLIES